MAILTQLNYHNIMKTKAAKPEKGQDLPTNDSAIAYVEGDAAEVWVFQGDSSTNTPHEVVLPHPRTGEPTKFAVIVRNEGPAIGEIRLFQSPKSASTLIVGPSDFNDPAEGRDAVSDTSTDASGSVNELIRGAESIDTLWDIKYALWDEIERLTDEIKDFSNPWEYYCGYEWQEEDKSEEEIQEMRREAEEDEGRTLIPEDECPEEVVKPITAAKARIEQLNDQVEMIHTRIAHMNAQIRNENDEKAYQHAREREALITHQDCYVVTNIDIVFLLLPVLSPSLAKERHAAMSKYLPFDDLMDAWRELASDAKYITGGGWISESKEESLDMTSAITEALARVCDTQIVGDELYYRFSEDKFTQAMVKKAQSIVDGGLPESLSESAASQIEMLAAPPPVLTSEESGNIAADTPGILSTESESQGSVASSVFDQAEQTSAMTTADVVVEPSQADSLKKLNEVRFALSYILANYVPPHLVKKIREACDTGTVKGADFRPVVAKLEQIRDQKAANVVAQNQFNSGRKRSAEDDEKAEERAEKKRKMEEDAKKKKAEPAGIKALRKVDTSGMKTMSAFFKPKAK